MLSWVDDEAEFEDSGDEGEDSDAAVNGDGPFANVGGFSNKSELKLNGRFRLDWNWGFDVNENEFDKKYGINDWGKKEDWCRRAECNNCCEVRAGTGRVGACGWDETDWDCGGGEYETDEDDDDDEEDNKDVDDEVRDEGDGDSHVEHDDEAEQHAESLLFEVIWVCKLELLALLAAAAIIAAIAAAAATVAE